MIAPTVWPDFWWSAQEHWKRPELLVPRRFLLKHRMDGFRSIWRGTAEA
jgi:hypothetical protein